MTTIPGAREIKDPLAEAGRLAEQRKIPERVRKVLDGAVTVVKPGETLVIRADTCWTPNMIREYQRALDYWHFEGGQQRLPFRVIVLAGEEFAIAEAAG